MKRLVFLFIATLTLIACKSDIPQAKKVADDFYKYRKMHRYDLAANLVSERLYQKISKKDFQRTLDSLQKIYGNVEFYDAVHTKEKTAGLPPIVRLIYRVNYEKALVKENLWLVKDKKDYKIYKIVWEKLK